MTIVDRYLLLQFLKIFFICFVSFAGLYVVIHMSTNLDEVVEIAGRPGGVTTLAADFYGPRVLDFFNRTAGILILVAAVFAIAMMQRRRESTATEAAGITKFRLVRSIVFAAIVIIAMAAVCREIYIPHYKATLVRSLTNWTDSGTVAMHQVKDLETGILVKGEKLILNESRISNIQLTLPRRISTEYLDLKADFGVVLANNNELDRPAGVLLQVNIEPAKILDSADIRSDQGDVVVFTPVSNAWLKPTEVFVVCDLDVDEIAYGENLSQYSSLVEMIESLKRPSNRFGLGDQVAIHSRIIQPFLEFTLLLVGLPVVICNPNRNIFLGAAICMIMIMGIQAVSAACQSLGGYGMIQPAALAAWIPIFVFFPFSAFSIRKLFD